MVYISASGSMSEKRSNWRLSIVSDFFWAIVNFFGLLYVSGALVAVHERCAPPPPRLPFLPSFLPALTPARHPLSRNFGFGAARPPQPGHSFNSLFVVRPRAPDASRRASALLPLALLTPPLRARATALPLAQADETKKIGSVHEKEDGGRGGGGGGDDGKPKGHKRPGQAGSNVKSMADRRRDPGNMPAGGG